MKFLEKVFVYVKEHDNQKSEFETSNKQSSKHILGVLGVGKAVLLCIQIPGRGAEVHGTGDGENLQLCD